MELLEALRIQTGRAFISDLRGFAQVHFLGDALQKINVRQYDVQEWEKAVNYITGSTKSFQTQEEAAEYLKNF